MDVQPEAIIAILEVMIVTDELGRGAAAVGNPNRAEPHESEAVVRVLDTAIYNVHFQNLLCNLLLERRAPVALGERLGLATLSAQTPPNRVRALAGRCRPRRPVVGSTACAESPPPRTRHGLRP